MKQEIYQLILDGLLWRRQRLGRADKQMKEIYCSIINRATGHSVQERGLVLQFIGVVLAHIVVFLDCLRRFCLR